MRYRLTNAYLAVRDRLVDAARAVWHAEDLLKIQGLALCNAVFAALALVTGPDWTDAIAGAIGWLVVVAAVAIIRSARDEHARLRDERDGARSYCRRQEAKIARLTADLSVARDTLVAHRIDLPPRVPR